MGRASDAGPERGQYRWKNPDIYKYTCYGCGLDRLSADETIPCQGAHPDLCPHRLCLNCEVRCWSCGLPACEEHRIVAQVEDRPGVILSQPECSCCTFSGLEVASATIQ